MALRTPISRVRSVTLTSMMFITPMPPTNRPSAEMAMDISTIMPVILSKFSMMESAVEIVKSSSALRGRVAQLAERAADLFDGIGALPGTGLAVRKKLVGLRIADARGFERDDDLAVQPVLAEEAALGWREDADDGELAAIQDHGSADAIAGGKQGLGESRSDHATRWRAQLFLARENPARLQFARRNVIEVCASRPIRNRLSDSYPGTFAVMTLPTAG